MEKSKKFQKMLVDAEAAGYQVERSSEAIAIFKGRQGQKGIRVFADRTAIELGLQLDAAKPIRTIAGMRQTLGL